MSAQPIHLITPMPPTREAARPPTAASHTKACRRRHTSKVPRRHSRITRACSTPRLTRSAHVDLRAFATSLPLLPRCAPASTAFPMTSCWADHLAVARPCRRAARPCRRTATRPAGCWLSPDGRCRTCRARASWSAWRCFRWHGRRGQRNVWGWAARGRSKEVPRVTWELARSTVHSALADV